MRLIIKTWISNSDNVKAGSLFGVVDADNPDMLPAALTGGHWDTFRTVDESEFKLSREAKEAIAKHGHYLFGAGSPLSELLTV
jgi:hypothetical protein